MEKEEIVDLTKETNCIKTLEGVTQFVEKHSQNFCTFVNGDSNNLLESMVNKQYGLTSYVIEIKKKEVYHTKKVNGVTIYLKGEDKFNNETVYRDFIKFKLIVNPNYTFKPIKEPELWEMDKDNWNNFIKDVSSQVEIDIADVEIWS